MSLIKMVMVSYLDESEIKNSINELKLLYGLRQYCYIKHDIIENDEKEHFHIYLRFLKPVNQSCICKFFGISVKQVQKVTSYQAYIAYMLHLFEEDKHKYPKERLVYEGLNIEQVLLDAEDNNGKVMSEDEHLYFLVTNLLEGDYNLRACMNYCITNGCWSVFRKNYTIFRDIAKGEV